jgi:predicted  nucleic acid-binding Zn-ribbon protein
MSDDLVPVNEKINEVNDKLKNLLRYSEDFDKSRSNLVEIIQKGHDALNDFSVLASQSGNYKDYEALSALMKTVIEANKSLMDLHQLNKRISEDKESKKSNDSKETMKNYGNTNIIMVGSSKDLLSMLKSKEMTEENDV